MDEPIDMQDFDDENVENVDVKDVDGTADHFAVDPVQTDTGQME